MWLWWFFDISKALKRQSSCYFIYYPHETFPLGCLHLSKIPEEPQYFFNKNGFQSQVIMIVHCVTGNLRPLTRRTITYAAWAFRLHGRVIVVIREVLQVFWEWAFKYSCYSFRDNLVTTAQSQGCMITIVICY